MKTDEYCRYLSEVEIDFALVHFLLEKYISK